ncbi:hypothetical protein M0802_006391 [Mischocyttarus mexicanus]|nr:hypothetical protein M0802_006391 [Mischocyttarus mexicanus]
MKDEEDENKDLDEGMRTLEDSSSSTSSSTSSSSRKAVAGTVLAVSRKMEVNSNVRVEPAHENTKVQNEENQDRRRRTSLTQFHQLIHITLAFPFGELSQSGTAYQQLSGLEDIGIPVVGCLDKINTAIQRNQIIFVAMRRQKVGADGGSAGAGGAGAGDGDGAGTGAGGGGK